MEGNMRRGSLTFLFGASWVCLHWFVLTTYPSEFLNENHGYTSERGTNLPHPLETSTTEAPWTSTSALEPPDGHPWHAWSFPDINVTVLNRMMIVVNETLGTLLRVSPYICQKGGHVLRSRSTSKENLNMKNRPLAFEETLKLAFEIGRNLSSRHIADKRIHKLLQMEFPLFLFWGDRPGSVKWQLKSHFPRGEVPLLTWSTGNGNRHRNSWPIPTYKMWENSLSSKGWDKKFRQWNRTYSWHEKSRSAVWLGSPTGPLGTEHWEDLPRSKLIQLSMDRPELVDAAFYRASGPWKAHEEEIKNKSRILTRMKQEDFMKYMAIIDIDGNSWSSRFCKLLCYNSVVIKVHPEDVDYNFKDLQPWKHYVPLPANMSNLYEIVEYIVADENREEMQSIVQNANSWCRSKLVQAQLATDLLWILVSYVELIDRNDKELSKTVNASEWPLLEFEPIP